MQVQGGEKKVMKKVLSLTLAASLLGGAFAGVAGAATDLTVEQQFKALFDAGVFAGVDAKGTPGLDQEMTRAQMAVIIAKLKGLTQDAAGQSFADVRAGYWGAGWIGAATKANLFAGVGENKFNPEGTVTIEEIAVVVAKAFGLTESTTAVEGKVSDWAKGWVAAAVGANLLPKFSDYTTVADRGDLVAATYTVYEASQHVSVTSAKATGLYKVEVAVSRPVDKTKAALTLKKGTLNVPVTTVWSEDGKSAVLTVTGSKISSGEYTVALGGIAADSIGTASASFTAEDEKVAALEFVGTSDTLAVSDTSTVWVKATNQYGEIASYGAGAFTFFALGQTGTPVKNDDGILAITVDTKDASLFPGSTVIPVNVYVNDTRLTASKTFKLGNQPFVTSLEVGEVVYPDKKTALSAQNDVATIPLKLFDQYGNPIVAAQVGDSTKDINVNIVNVVVNPYSQELAYVPNSFAYVNGKAQVQLRLSNKVDKSADYTVNLYVGSAVGKATVKVGASALATSLSFGDAPLIAAGDSVAYLPIIATDANGVTLTKQQIADNASRFNFAATGTVARGGEEAVAVVTAGSHKGELKLNLDTTLSNRNRVFVTGSILTMNANSFAQKEITVQPARVPDHLIIKDQDAKKAIIGATAKAAFQVIDQYGSELAYTGTAIPDAIGQNYVYQIVVTNQDLPVPGQGSSGLTTTPGSAYTAGYKLFNFTAVVDGAENNEGTHTLSAVIQRKSTVTGSTYSDYSAKVNATVTVIDKESELTYSVTDAATLYATTDGAIGAPNNALGDTLFGRELKLTAKDASGDTVAVPAKIAITNVVSSDETIVGATYVDATDSVDKNVVLGKKEGSANLSISVKNEFRNEAVVVNKTIAVKKDAIVATKFDEVEATAYYGTAGTHSAYTLMGDYVVIDQYGNKFKGADLTTYAAKFSIRYAVSNVNGTGTVTVNQSTGALTITGSVSFTLTATTINGLTATTEVSK